MATRLAFLEVIWENFGAKWEKGNFGFVPAILLLTAKKLDVKLEKGKWISLHKVIIRQLYGAGLSTISVGILFGVSTTTIRRWMKSYGIERRPISKFEHKQVSDEALIATFKEEKSINRTANKLGMAYQTTRRRLIALGLHKLTPHFRLLNGSYIDSTEKY